MSTLQMSRKHGRMREHIYAHSHIPREDVKRYNIFDETF